MSRWVDYAMVLLEARYPRPPFEYRLEQPRVEISEVDNGGRPLIGQAHIVPDVAIYEGERLVAVVEVGDLSRQNKLQLLENYLPGVQVWWISKTDLLPAVIPDLNRFRFITDARLDVGNRLLTQIVKERGELDYLRRSLRQGTHILRNMAKLWRQSAEAFLKWEQETVEAMSTVDRYSDSVVRAHSLTLGEPAQQGGESPHEVN